MERNPCSIFSDEFDLRKHSSAPAIHLAGRPGILKAQ